MLLFQVKKLTSLYIFAVIISCQLNTGYYNILNLDVNSDLLAAGSKILADAHVVGRPPAPGLDQLAQWAISLPDGGKNTIQNALTSQYLSVQGNQTILTSQPTRWLISKTNDGSFTISPNNETNYLGISTSTNPHDIIISSSTVGANTRWLFQKIY